MSCRDIPRRHLAFTRLLYLSVMPAHSGDPRSSRSPVSRRQVLAAGGTGLLAATASASRAAARTRKARAAGDGTPEQIHLTWGENPATSVVISWASPGPATRPRVRIGQRVIPAEPRQYTDGSSGETVWTYHARVGGLRAGATYAYVVTADNDDNAADPFTATFRTAPHGRAAFRFTLDLAAPNTAWGLSYGQSAYAVDAVESFQPLFHLLNGDLCYADLNPAVPPEVWRDFGNNNQTSAACRPWMPCLGNHEVEFDNGMRGYTSYLTRYTLPDNHVPGFGGRWYSFRVGSVLFVSLDADDVVCQDAGTSFYIQGYSGGAQTAWLEQTLAAGRGDPSVDWIIVQMHQCACSSSATGNGSDLGIRQQWRPLFDRYQVDLVLTGHDHHYERSPVTTTGSGVFDTSQGTVHLILGCEDAVWSARRGTSTGYGIAVFDVHPDPEDFGGQTSITVTQYHAVGADPVNPGTGDKGAPTPDYTEFETFTLVRPRRG
jgi:Calcineurin-like phosphoesterase/Purple acid Phosphatase, N-terminal domain